MKLNIPMGATKLYRLKVDGKVYTFASKKDMEEFQKLLT